MLRNYILTAFRTFKRNKTYATLNILGLALGIGCAYVLFSVIDYHIGFDKHQSNFDKIYRIVGKDIYPDRETFSMGTQHPFAAALKNDYPELEAVAKVNYIYGDQINVYQENGDIQKYSIEEGMVFVENDYFEIFDVEWIAGNPKTVLNRPNTVVLALSQVKKFFGLDESLAHLSIGKTINLSNQVDLEIVGVIADPVNQTNFPFTVLIEYEALAYVNPYYSNNKDSWHSTSSNTNTYFMANDGFDLSHFDESMDAFVENYMGEGKSDTQKYYAQPLSEVHFDEVHGAYVTPISKQLLIALGVIAFFLIFTASINFINLSTAQAANRAKEIGIRKAIGGFVRQLRMQFLAEIMVITALALLLSLSVSELMFILLEDLLGYRLSLDLLSSPYKLFVLLGLFVVVSLMSGLYPSFLLAKLNTVTALKSKINMQHTGGFNLRKALVIAQFAISQLLIIGTIVIKIQADYFLNKEVGFEKDAIVSTYLPERDIQKLDRFRNELLSSPAISDISMSLAEPSGNSDSWSNINYAPLGSETSYHANFKICDDRFAEFWGIELLAGRFVKPSDSLKNGVINKKLADLMGFEGRYDEVIGETLITGWAGNKKIVGVTEDFHVERLTEDLSFVVMVYEPDVWYNASFKIAAGANPKDAITHYEETWESIFPEYVSDYQFYDQLYAEQYENEINTSKLLMIFSVISIMIGCLGLYGLVSFLAINKTKEIGVRKVLGASIWNILGIYSRELMVLLGVSFLLAAPIAYYLLKQVLDEITYRIDLSVTYFIAGLVVTSIIAIITISHRTLASARLNPAITLKDE